MRELGRLVADPFGAILGQSGHPSAPLARHSELAPMVHPGNEAAIVTARRRSTVLAPLGPLGDPDKGAGMLRRLAEDARIKSVVITQTRQAHLPMVRAAGFKSEVFGRSYSIHLPDFTDRGKPLAKVRQNIHRAEREGVAVREVIAGEELSSIVAAVSTNWLRQKGFHTKKLKLLVGEDKPLETKTTRTFVAYRDGRAVAFVMYSATSADSESWLYDLTRRSTEAPLGAIEAINMHAVHTFAAEGRKWLHLGLTPFVGVDDDSVLHESRRLSWLMRFFADHGDRLYPARNQERFKLKWNPHVVEPEYISIFPDVSAASLYNLLRLTNMV
jgi:lysylphosphatidylglycerol synthetase-like protein (DUF2156 family)